MEHTPTPWSLTDSESQSQVKAGPYVYHPHYSHVAPSMELRANAAFIVKACNLHDELVAALRAALPHLIEHHQDAGAYTASKLVEAAIAKAAP